MTKSDTEMTKGIASVIVSRIDGIAPRQAISGTTSRRCDWTRSLLVLGLALAVAGSARAQDQQSGQALAVAEPQASAPAPSPDESTSKTAGDYAITQSVEFGYRDSIQHGNINNYDTFEDLNSGLRLFDYSVDMHSIDHRGIFFDNLSFMNSGYGGDPNDISRLRLDKGKWYDFRAMFRRDHNYFNYSLLANPLNPTSGPLPNAAIVNSPQAMDLSRKMQDYDLTLFPQSRLRFRVGYSRNSDTGPQYNTIEGGTEPLLWENVNEVTNSYRLGVDYRGLPRTTLSFDELLTYTAINNSETDPDLSYQLANGTPVDLGIVSTGTTPCTAASITPAAVSSTCNGYLSYSQVQNPRSQFPVERFSFESSYFKNFATSGSASYSESQNILGVGAFSEIIAGWSSRTLARGSTSGGPAFAHRVSTSANWSGDYSLTSKLSLTDSFLYDDFRIPGQWATAETNVYDEPNPPALAGMLRLPFYPTPVNIANFATLCPTPFTGVNCPQHSSSSGADVTDELAAQYLAQNRRSNTVELKYDFLRRLSAYVGYEFTARTIEDFSATWDTGELMLPGGAGGTAGLSQGGTKTGNYFFAARGDCAILATGLLPAGCTLNSNGSIVEGSPTNLVPEAGNNTAPNFYEIHEQAGLAGIIARPMDALRINADVVIGYNDNSFTRISPRQVQSYKVHGRYNPRPWASLDAAVDIHENRDNVYTVDNIEHGRTYSAMATLAPKSTFWVDFGYTYADVYTQTEICFADTGSTVFTVANSPCPVAASVAAGVTLGTLSNYSSRDNFAYVDASWKPIKRLTGALGYSGSAVRGSTTFLNPLTPNGTLDFTYLKPFVSVAFDLYKGLSYKTAWNYYGYDTHDGPINPAGLVPLPSQNFNGSNVTFSLRYLF